MNATMLNRLLLIVFPACVLIHSIVLAESVSLLNVSRGNLPNDTALETKTTLTIEEHPILGAKSLKVVFAEGDSFGVNNAGMKNWDGYDAIEFAAFNPSRETVLLVFTVKHGGTKTFQTRINYEIKFRSGKNKIRIDLATLQNEDGSKPDLTRVRHWYLSNAKKTPTLFFGDFSLVEGEHSSNADARPAGKTQRKIKIDADRLKRIRAATMPKFRRPVEFHTKEADAILSALEVFPPDNPWNEVIDEWHLHPNSKSIVASIGLDKPIRYNADMAFILVPPNQPLVDVHVVAYPDESDEGPYPVPDTTPIEHWPVGFQRAQDRGPLSLADVQADRSNMGGDRHAIVVDPFNRKLYEFYQMKRTKKGWQAAQASIFDLSSNQLRPDGWTSSDAAGLPVFPCCCST